MRDRLARLSRDVSPQDHEPHLHRALELLGLCTLALGQPVFSVVGGAPEFFAARKIPVPAIVAFGVTLIVGLPLLLLVIEAVAERARVGWGKRCHDGARLVLIAVIALGLLNGLDLEVTRATGVGSPGWVLLAVAVGAGWLAVRALRRSPGSRTFVRFLAAAAPAALAVFLLSAPMGSSAAATPAAASRPAPIVMLVLDELPTASLLGADGRIDADRLPNFARLAREGTWYPHTTTVADQTTAAVPAILSGRRGPRRLGSPGLDRWPENLFTLLRRQYRIDAREPITRLCPAATCPDESRSTPEAMSALASETPHLALLGVAPKDLAPRSPLIGGAGERDPGNDVGEFLANVGPGNRPTLDFAHLMLPHRPWGRLPSGRSYPVRDGGGVSESARETLRLTGDRREALAVWRAHLLQVGYADKLLGRVIAKLKRTEMYDRALVVVLSDHGVSFRPGESLRNVSDRTIQNIAPVPLFIKQPGGRGRGTNPVAAQTIDVLPTILDVIGARVPDGVQGVSLLRRVPRVREPHVLNTKAAYVGTTMRTILRERAHSVRVQSDEVIDSPVWAERCRLPESGCRRR